MSDEAANDSKWASSVVLGSGDSAFIRPLTPADQPALAEVVGKTVPRAFLADLAERSKATSSKSKATSPREFVSGSRRWSGRTGN